MRSQVPLKLLLKIILSSPDLIPFFVRGHWRKHINTTRDYKYGNGYALKPPYQISLRITNACNHRCDVCGQYGEKGYMLNRGENHPLGTLPIDTYKKLVDEVAFYRPLFYITGGEPFLYQGLAELMDYIKSRGCPASVVTNGVCLTKYAERIVRNGWDMVMVSFDGPKEVHDRCRNFAGAFDTAAGGLEEINFWKKKLKTVKPYLMTSTTISRKNANVLSETFQIGEKMRPDFMIVYLSWFTNYHIGETHSKLLKEKLGVTPYTWKSYVTEFSKEDAHKFAAAVEKVKKQKWSFDYLIIPNIKDISSYYLDPSLTFGYNKCVAPFIMIDVMPNGDVVTCRDYIDVKAGNITESPLLEIWNSPMFVNFRKLLIEKKGLLPQCSRCCGLMGF